MSSSQASTDPTPERGTDVLVRRAQAGDERAWAEIVQVATPTLRNVLQGRIRDYLRSSYDSEDLLQSTLLSAFQDLASFQYQGKGSLHRWFHTIALNRIIDYARKMQTLGRDARRNVPMPGEEADFGLEYRSRNASPVEESISVDQVWHIVRYLSDLPPGLGRPAILKIALGLEDKLIAETLEIPEAKVRRSIARVMGTVERVIRDWQEGRS